MTCKILMPLVNVIMPAYNASATIDESIKSVLAQTYANWKLIVINDASRDNTLQRAEFFSSSDSRIHVISNKENQGVAAARNLGLSASEGEFIAFLDSDDLWLPKKLEKQVRFMLERDSVISFTGTSYINSSGQLSDYNLQVPEKFTYNELLKRNLMSCSSVMVRRDAMLPFPSANIHEDYTVWMQIVKKIGYADGINESLLIYRMGESTKSSNRIKSARMNFNAYRYVGYGLLKSTLLSLRYAKHSISKRYKIRKRLSTV